MSDELVQTRYTADGDQEALVDGQWRMYRRNAVAKDRYWGAVNLLITGALLSLRLSPAELAAKRNEARRDNSLAVPIDEVAADVDDAVREEVVRMLEKMVIAGKLARTDLDQAVRFARTAT